MQNKVLVLHCTEGAQKALQSMSRLGYRLPSEISTMAFGCTGRINKILMLEGLKNGTKGILVVGCHKENCKYLTGNIRTDKRVSVLKNMLQDAGINKMVDMAFAAPDEGKKLYQTITDFHQKVKEI